MESSSSSDANNNKRTRSQSPLLLVDWSEHVRGHFGQDVLHEFLSVPELDTLVGWATHVNGYKTNQTTSVLWGLPNESLPPFMLDYINDIWLSFNANDSINSTTTTLDTTALVALGMLVEECVTTSMLPLARAHVRQCRAEPPDKFCNWTVPPEEAISSSQEEVVQEWLASLDPAFVEANQELVQALRITLPPE
jgi:hypothetical protein